jgi:predicted nucleic-acid-binding protein
MASGLLAIRPYRHDWLYTNHQFKKREDADKVLRTLLKENGVPAAKVEIIYRAVSFFGSAAWDNSADDVKYMKWLRQKLIGAGINVDKYQFPPESV